MNYVADKMRKRLINKADQKKADWLENYVKHGIKSRGVPIPQIRELLVELVKESGINNQPVRDQIDFIDDLMADIHTEDKLAAIIYLQLYWEKIEPNIQLRTISDCFDKEWIFDWNVCYWLCVRILSRLIDAHPRKSIPEMKQWNKNEYLWKARASIVAFIYSGSLLSYEKIIMQFSLNLIKGEERFAKTAVGWLLREYSKKDDKFVKDFIKTNSLYFTREVMNNSLKYFDKDLKKRLLQKLKLVFD